MLPICAGPPGAGGSAEGIVCVVRGRPQVAPTTSGQSPLLLRRPVWPPSAPHPCPSSPHKTFRFCGAPYPQIGPVLCGGARSTPTGDCRSPLRFREDGGRAQLAPTVRYRRIFRKSKALRSPGQATELSGWAAGRRRFRRRNRRFCRPKGGSRDPPSPGRPSRTGRAGSANL